MVLGWSCITSDVNGQNNITKIVACTICIKFVYYPVKTILFMSYIKFFMLIMSKKFDQIYIVASRSTLGIIRDLPIYIMCKVFKKKIAIHIHGSSVSKLKSILEMIFRKSKNVSIIIPSEHLRKQFKNYHVSLLENAFIAEERIDEISQTTLAKRKFKYRILWSSNIMYSKGIYDLMSKFAGNKNVELIVCGRPVADEYKGMSFHKEMLHYYSNYANIKIVGGLDRRDLLALHETVDFVALPSFYSSECQPLSLIDAMVYGKYLLVLDTEAIRSTIRDYPAVYLNKRLNEYEVEELENLLGEAQKSVINKDHIAAAKKRFSMQAFEEGLREIFIEQN